MVKGRAQSIVLTSNMSPGGGAYSRALKSHNPCSSPYVGVG